MENRIIIIANLELIGGNVSALQEVVQDLQAHCLKTEKGMLQYDWYVAEDKKAIKVLETYTDSEAVLFHFDNCKPFFSRLGEVRTFVGLEIYGDASAELRARVKKINGQHFKVVSYLNKLVSATS